MIRLLAALLLFVSGSLAPRAEAVPFSFGASINTVGSNVAFGHIVSSTEMFFFEPPGHSLVLTLPARYGSFGSSPFGLFSQRGSLLLLLHDGATGGVVGGYAHSRFSGEDSNAGYVICDRPDHCVSRFGPDPGSAGPLRVGLPFPGPTCDFGPFSCETLMFEVPMCPFGPPFCATEGSFSSQLVLPNGSDGRIVASLDFFAANECPAFFGPCPVDAAVSFTLDALPPEPVPEPTTLILWGATATGLGFVARRKAKKARADI